MTPTRLAWTGLAAGVTAVWVAFALKGGDGAPLHTTAAGAAAAAGMAALIGAGWRPATLGSLQAGAVALLVLPAATAAPAGGSTALLVAGLVLAAGAEVAVRWLEPATIAAGPRRPTRRARLGGALPVVAGCGLLAGGLLAERADAGMWVLPTGAGPTAMLVLAGAGVLVLVAGLGPSRVWALAVPALVAILPVAGHLPADAGVAAAAGVAVLAAALLPSRPSVALAALSVAAAASAAPVAAVAALLAAGAVLGLAVEHAGAALLGLPAAGALAALAVPAGRSDDVVTLALTGALVAACLVIRAGRAGPGRPWGPPLEGVPALVLAAWLVLAPGSWAWTGIVGMAPYERGAAVAVAAGALALLPALGRQTFIERRAAARGHRTDATYPIDWPSPDPDPDTPPPDPEAESEPDEPTPDADDDPPAPDGPLVVPIPARRHR